MLLTSQKSLIYIMFALGSGARILQCWYPVYQKREERKMEQEN
jgi:hypothetical protein